MTATRYGNRVRRNEPKNESGCRTREEDYPLTKTKRHIPRLLWREPSTKEKPDVVVVAQQIPQGKCWLQRTQMRGVPYPRFA